MASLRDHYRQQRQTLRDVLDFLADKGHPLNILAIAGMFGITHESSYAQANQLVLRGYLRRKHRKEREHPVFREPEDEITELIPIPIL